MSHFVLAILQFQPNSRLVFIVSELNDLCFAPIASRDTLALGKIVVLGGERGPKVSSQSKPQEGDYQCQLQTSRRSIPFSSGRSI